MTLAEAKTILATYKLPLSAGELLKYQQALAIVAGSAFKAP